MTKCSLAAITASQPINPKTNQPYRPTHLPPPTTLPLRHCSHNEDSTPIDETECLLSLFAPSPDGASKKNKEHYILATADPVAPEKVVANTKGDAKTRRRVETEALEAMKRAKSLRNHTRAIPGVPIVYVKRSVMVLEPMSAPSEGVRDGFERGKFRVGLNEPALGKRKRDGDKDGDGDGDGDGGGGDGANAERTKKKNKKDKKVKGPNPLSVKKPKKRDQPGFASGSKKETKEGETLQGDEPEPQRKEGDSSVPKPKRRRRHHHKSGNEADDGEPGEPESTAPEPAE